MLIPSPHERLLREQIGAPQTAHSATSRRRMQTSTRKARASASVALLHTKTRARARLCGIVTQGSHGASLPLLRACPGIVFHIAIVMSYEHEKRTFSLCGLHLTLLQQREGRKRAAGGSGLHLGVGTKKETRPVPHGAAAARLTAYECPAKIFSGCEGFLTSCERAEQPAIPE